MHCRYSQLCGAPTCSRAIQGESTTVAQIMTTKRKLILAVLVIVLILVALDIYLGSAFPGFPFCNARGQCL